MEQLDPVERTPSLPETLLRAILMGGSSALDEARRRARVVVTPGLGERRFYLCSRNADSASFAPSVIGSPWASSKRSKSSSSN